MSSAMPSPPIWCKSIQAQLNRLKAGIVVIKNVNMSRTWQVPDPVQSAFNDAVKATCRP